MKKTIKSLFAIALTAFAFAACSDVPEPYQIPSEKQPGGGELPAGVIAATDFKANGPSMWKIQDVVHPTEIEDVWTYNSKYGMVATAAKNSGADNYASESWLVGPEFDLTNEQTAYLVINHAGNYFSNISNECSVLISTDYGTRSVADEATWEKVTIDTWPTNFTYVDGGANIDKYAGKKIHIAFKYTSTNTKAGTWEIASVTISKEAPKQELPTGLTGEGTKDNPFTVADALKICEAFGEKGYSEDVYVQGIVSGFNSSDAFNPQYGNRSYYISADGTEASQLGVYRGYGLGGEKFKSEDDLKTGDRVIVVGRLLNFKGNTPQFNSGSKLYKLNDQVAPGEEEIIPGTPDGDGSKDKPFNVAAAVKKCQETGTTATADVFYVKGIVDADYTVDSYKNATLVLVDAAGATEKFTAYRIKDAEGKGLKEGYKISKGATVIVYGKLVNYTDKQGKVTPETSQNTGVLVSVNGQAPEVDGGEGGGESGGGESSGTDLAKAVNGAVLTFTHPSLTASSNEASVDFSAQGWTNSADATTVTLPDGTTIAWAKGSASNPPKYYDLGTAVRMYSTNKMIITSKTKKIAKIVINCDSQTKNEQTTNYVGNEQAYGKADGQVITIVNDFTSGTGGTQLRPKTMTITYATE